MIPLGKGTFCLTEVNGNVTIGNYCSVGHGCHFHTEGTHLYERNHKCVYTTNYDQVEALPIVIGNDVWIGREAKILDGVKIGNGVIVGAYTVVAKDIPSYSVVVGNPMRVVRVRFTPEQQEKLEKIKWWEWEKEVIKSRINDMKKIDLFLEKYGTQT